ncbi:MFS general substrate transporter [Mycena albidolilacea]|uniref:MFS general substrate transporter n=1 Tax=Mycena albidolilacea TaxID=1033008 RepID=A0AAD6ZU39_9AGAR|nr:MFS general substrate transporter [Mycena albidolilacea]
MSSPSVDKHCDEKHIEYETAGAADVSVSMADVDTGAMVASGVDVHLDPDEAVRLRRVAKKIDRHILPLMCGAVQFMDKTTLGNAAILGIKQGAHLITDQLGTIFYLAYLVMQFPQNLALQRFPIAKWMSFNIFLWGVSLCCHAACHNFAGLMVVRTLLGACEGFLFVTAMFYTRREQGVRVGYWFFMNGFAQIISGFLSFGILHIKPGKIAPWQWLMLITGIMTLITAVCFWFFFPDSPTTAWFLTPRERTLAVLRIKENQTGVENKRFKKEQMIEALKDRKTWLFAAFSAFTQVPNSLSNQKPLIVNSFGFTVLQTTLLTCVDGVISIATIALGVHVAARTNQRGYTAFAWKSPNILGAILIMSLPWSNRVGLLFALWVSGIGSTSFVIFIAWLTSVTAGHTKRVTNNAIMLIAYCIGNAVGPFMWKDKYKPRNRVPWAIIVMCFVVCMVLLLLIRWELSAENKRRDQEPSSDKYDNVYVERLSPDGVTEKVKVDKEFLDLTDIQNRDFRYVL